MDWCRSIKSHICSFFPRNLQFFEICWLNATVDSICQNLTLTRFYGLSVCRLTRSKTSIQWLNPFLLLLSQLIPLFLHELFHPFRNTNRIITKFFRSLCALISALFQIDINIFHLFILFFIRNIQLLCDYLRFFRLNLGFIIS